MQQHQREHRRSKRNPKRQAAWIAYGSNNIRLPCMIWDLSESGARLAAPRSKSLPNTFLLVFNRDGTARRGCRVAWRNDAQVGVQFVSPDELDEDSPRYPIKARQAPVAQRSPDSNHASGQYQRADTFISLRSVGVNDAAGTISRRSGTFFSSSAAVLLTLLASATLMFHWAGLRSEKQAWAHQVCDAASNFCEHPEMMAVASVLMGIVFLAARGMAR
jgi:PilZ domain